MKIIIAVTDACIFIDLHDLELTDSFFNLDFEIHTTTAVLYELYNEQQQILRAYQSVNRLTIHNLQEQDFIEIHLQEYPKSLVAYQYVVNGKSAIEWIMERYRITTHPESGIVNNPNDWALEAKNPRYILDLLLNVIALSEQTVDIVQSLPEVKFDE